MKEIISIQYLRGGAALLVVLHHCVNIASAKYSLGDFHFQVGAIGVDIFFVISGFIMFTVSEAKPISAAQFMKRRIVRVAPLYWVLTFVAAIVSTEGGLQLALQYDLERLARSLFFIPQWHDTFTDVAAPILVVGWTLNLEMMFYALFAVSLFLPTAYRLPALCAVLLALAVSRAFVDEASNPALLLYTDSIVLEFGFGVLLGLAYQKGLLTRAAPSTRLKLGLALLAVSVVWLFKPLEHSAIRAFVWGVPALLICISGLLCEEYLKARPIGVLKLMGDASYSIYLSHLMTLGAVQIITGAILGAAFPYLALSMWAVSALIVGCAVYFILERPLTNSARKWIRQANQKVRTA